MGEHMQGIFAVVAGGRHKLIQDFGFCFFIGLPAAGSLPPGQCLFLFQS
jgi:hypothetical protein